MPFTLKLKIHIDNKIILIREKMKIFCLILLVIVSFSCKTFNESQRHISGIPEEQLSSNNISEDYTEKFTVFTIDNNAIFEIGQIIDVLDYQGVVIIVFETSTKDDFVIISANESSLGIPTEYAWIKYAYSEYSLVKQYLIDIKINNKVFECDLFLIKNDSTGELKNIYFEISDFFGK